MKTNKIVRLYIKLYICKVVPAIFLLGFLAPVQAQQRFFLPLDTRNGLSENNVKCIVQDNAGFMWFGTKNGLNRYDGVSFKLYNVDDYVKKCGNHNVSALYEDNSHRLWVGTDKGVYIFDPVQETFTLFDTTVSSGEKIDNWIARIMGDRHGNVWIIAPNQGAFRYELSTKRLFLYNYSHAAYDYHDNPSCICMRQNGDVWFATDGGGLLRYDSKEQRMTVVTEDRNGNTLCGYEFYAMCDYGEWIAIADHEGRLMKYNPTTKELKDVNAPNVHYKLLRALLYDGKELCVGTQDGLYFVDEAVGREEQIKANNLHPYGLASNMIYSLYHDRDGGLWVGTIYNGVFYMPRNGMKFRNFIPIPGQNSLSGRNIRELRNDSMGRVWIASEEGTLDVYDPYTGLFRNVDVTKYKGGNNRLALMQDGDKMWVGVFKNGVDVIDIHSLQSNHYSPSQLGIYAEGSPYALFKDSKSRIWMGTGRGVYLKGEGMHFFKIDVLEDAFIQDIAEDRNGNIWVASMGSGVYVYSPQTGKVKRFCVNGKGNSISSNSVSSVSFDHNGNPWFATDRGGICRYDMKTKRFESFSSGNFLPDDVTYKMLEDKNGNLWFGTNHGLVCFNPSSHSVAVYGSWNGLIDNQFSYKSAVKTAKGTFLFGGMSGLVEFDPLVITPKAQRIFITNIRINGCEQRPGEGILDGNILQTEKIHLPHDMNNVSFDVSNQNYDGTQSKLYEYKMEGVDGEWNRSLGGTAIAYTRLQPGKYTFMVRPAGNEKAVRKLVIVVNHPWYSTIWAKTVYFLMLCCVVYLLLRMYHQRQIRHLKRRERAMNEERDKELLKAKISFFTNITHELRTPLTLINGSVENITQEKVDNPKLNRNINAIDKNCKRLLNLTNQLLDFRKIESNATSLSITEFDVCKLMTSIVDRFEPAVTNLRKLITLDLKEDDVMLQADREAFTKIISNLLNNARKYSETFIQVELYVQGDCLWISVINDGTLIPADKTELIFQPFERLDDSGRISGSGIGLPMARSLAEIHGGTLTVDKTSEYNKFVLVMPLKQKEGTVVHLSEEKSLINDEAMATDDVVSDDAVMGVARKEYTVLVVEDNAEVAEMVAEKLTDTYDVLLAKDGEEGLEMLSKSHVDIVISDIMMPVMDGLQMTQKIKANVETSHIPVILLTARQTMDSNIEGLKSGADAYIVKPFSATHLLTQIQNLLENRKRERESFIHKPYLPSSKSGINKADEEFMNKMTGLIMEHIRQPEFNVEQLASAMCMSRSSLHRKIKDVSNLTPVDFIRLVRLKKAAELIREYNYRVVEVCEMVGINSPSYFIKLFHRQFGMTPKEFADKKE